MSLRRFRPEAILATWFWSGSAPKAPGTFGSLAALPFAWGLQTLGGGLALILAAGLVFMLGLWAVTKYLKDSVVSDPQEVVIDEVVGQWIALCLVPPTLLSYAIGFAAFRLFDITKPWPVNWADREIEGAAGVMLDDVLAGVYASLTTTAALFMLNRFLPGIT